MKILLVCNYRPGVGGISGQVEELQKHLRKEGHDVDVFSTKGSALKRLSLPRKLRNLARDYDVLHVHCCSPSFSQDKLHIQERQVSGLQ